MTVNETEKRFEEFIELYNLRMVDIYTSAEETWDRLARLLRKPDNILLGVEEIIDLKMKVKKLYEKIKAVLKDRERTIVELRFGLNGTKPKTQNEIAEMMGISRSYVSRIETKAIGKLAKEIKD